MATWFATAAGNINSAGRWNSAPGGGGSSLTWPPNAADILVANSFTITVNVSVTVAEFRNGTTGGATTGGYFNCTTSGVTVTGIGHNDGNVATGIFRSAVTSGTLAFVGAISGGSGASAVGLFSSAGSPTITITGAVTGGSASGAHGISLTGAVTPTLNVTGDVTGGSYVSSGSLAMGIRVANVATVNITGNVVGNADYAIGNESTGTVTVSGYAQASTSAAAVLNTGQGVVQVGATTSASNGRGAVSGAFRYASATAATTSPLIAGTQKTLSVLDVTALVPAQTDVKAGVVYGDAGYTGTYVPSVGSGSKHVSMAGRL